ncbi:MAG: 2-succinyl-5-enolpyruvyl-6-hydroxy-3-cyclohexene-1-carboxylic-acid synthase [Rhodocyclaceae bacterium]
MSGQLNLDWSAAIIGGLVAAGVSELVLSPGSRSTPLALAALRHPQLRCEVVLDERSAGWFALGLAKAGGKPVALLCTSGTAAANWLPAVVEANQSAVPLLLLSADRPPELQGWGANQTIEQSQLFVGQTRAFHAPGAPFPGFDPHWLHQLMARAVAESRWPLPGPVHLNLAFREPLLPADPVVKFDACAAVEMAPPQLTPDPDSIARLAARLAGRRGVIVCGGADYDDDFPKAVTALAAALACPILAEPHSGLRFGPHDRSRVCSHHERWLRDDGWREQLRPEWILRFGAYPVTRTLQNYLASCADLFLVEAHGRWPDPQHRTRQLLRADPAAACQALLQAKLQAADSEWMAAFQTAEAETRQRQANSPLPPEADLFSRLCATLPPETAFFCGNSMPIRDLAAWSGSGPQSIRFHANRGASGIDGNIATAAGLAGNKPAVAVIGDLTAQHDIGSLVLMRQRPLVLVVINNGGGGIFDFLAPAALPEYEAGWLTPQNIDFADAAATFGIPYRRCTDPTAVVAATGEAFATHTPLLIEFSVARGASLALRRQTSGG